MKPILKWAGGKRQLLNVIRKFLNNETLGCGTYFEPFFGGGSVYFSLQPKKAVINDFNKELVNVYNVVKNNPEKLIELLKKHHKNNSVEYFYKIRSLDRNKLFNLNNNNDIFKASRTIYLNKTCFNGLYRVNLKGQFNVPYAYYKNPQIFEESNIHDISNFFRKTKTIILNVDFEKAVEKAKKGDFIYFDPPYDYENKNGFTKYNKEGFSRNDLIRLKKVSDSLILKGCTVLISNNDTSFVRELFSNNCDNFNYKIVEIYANRSINCKGNFRTNAKEVLIYGKKI